GGGRGGARDDPARRDASAFRPVRSAIDDGGRDVRRAMIAGLRPATAADADGVAALVDRAYGHYVARIGRKPYPMVVDYAEALTAMRGFVVERAGRIVGLLLLEEGDGYMMVENVAVDPGLWGTGLGRAL